MFLENKYKKWYYSIILNARKEKRIKNTLIYYEKHHIIPKCLNGTNDKENLVLLTAKEHFICHKLLCKMTNKTKEIYLLKSAVAYFMNNTKRNLSSKYIEEARKIQSDNKKKQIPWNKGIKHSEETKRKIGLKNSRTTLTESGRIKKIKFMENNNPMKNPLYAERAKINRSKFYEMISPEGKKFTIRNLAEFCKNNNLHKGNMCSVSKGKLKHYKGWKCIQIIA
jgi:hypothetical protein